jgi:hypothetical protein
MNVTYSYYENFINFYEILDIKKLKNVNNNLIYYEIASYVNDKEAMGV